MKTTMRIAACAAAALFCALLNAQEITGDWQGTLRSPDARLVIRVSRDEAGGWKALVYNIDQSSDPQRADSLAVNAQSVKLTVNSLRAAFEGKLDGDGRTMRGVWTQGPARPLELQLATRESAWPVDEAAHSAHLLTVDNGVKLEVLDWGGTGRPMILLAGLGNTAHIFDKFAPKLAQTFHVYGITRRGFGASSRPTPTAENYAADRLGDDVLEVLEALKIQQPILVGHSMSGEELSSIGSRHPDRVAGLVYLDAGYAYAFYSSERGDFNIDVNEFERKLQQARWGNPAVIPELLAELPGLERSLRAREKRLAGTSSAAATVQDVPSAIRAGEQRYTKISAPTLAIFAVPKPVPASGGDEATRQAIREAQASLDEAQAKVFEAGVPRARVVRIANAEHYMFLSNPTEVLSEIRAFAGGLK